MKKLLTLILVLFMSVIITGCSDNEEKMENVNTEPTGYTVVELNSIYETLQDEVSLGDDEKTIVEHYKNAEPEIETEEDNITYTYYASDNDEAKVFFIFEKQEDGTLELNQRSNYAKNYLE